MTADKASRLESIRAANRQKLANDTQANLRTARVQTDAATAKAPALALAQSDTLISVGMRAVLLLLLLTVGGLLVLVVAQIWTPLINSTLPSMNQELFLAFSRASALVGYLLIWLSMALGLAISSRLVRLWPGGPAAADLHEHFGLLGLIFASMHVIFLLGDRTLGYSLESALSPFSGSSYRPLWMGLLGKSALYLTAIVSLSFYLRKRIGSRWWRRIHYLSFAVFLTTLIHGMAAGSDTDRVWALAMYLLSTTSLLGLLAFRIVGARLRASLRLTA